MNININVTVKNTSNDVNSTTNINIWPDKGDGN